MNDSFRFTVPLLQQYCAAALENAADLAKEAVLLHENGHIARAYFLAVASIEETGKAVQSFDAQGLNLTDSAVNSKLRRNMEDHSQKITSALIPMLLSSTDYRNDLPQLIDLLINLKRGREPSMYTDIRYPEPQIRIPKSAVRERAAKDCIRLALACLANAMDHFQERDPPARDQLGNQLFTMKQVHFQKVLSTEDFWWYYIEKIEAGRQDFAAAAVEYHRDYFSKNKSFVPTSDDGADQ